RAARRSAAASRRRTPYSSGTTWRAPCRGALRPRTRTRAPPPAAASRTRHVRAAVHLDGDVHEGGDAGEARAIVVGRERVLRHDAEHGRMARPPDAPDVQVGELGVAVALDRGADLAHDRRIHLAIEEHARRI